MLKSVRSDFGSKRTPTPMELIKLSVTFGVVLVSGWVVPGCAGGQDQRLVSAQYPFSGLPVATDPVRPASSNNLRAVSRVMAPRRSQISKAQSDSSTGSDGVRIKCLIPGTNVASCKKSETDLYRDGHFSSVGKIFGQAADIEKKFCTMGYRLMID